MSPLHYSFLALFAIVVESTEAKAKMGKKLFSADILQLVESYSEPRDSMKLKMVHKQMSKMKITGNLNLFPNETYESRVNVLLDMRTTDISWEDPGGLFQENWKEEISICLKKRGKELSNCLFDHSEPTGSYFIHAVRPFMKELLRFMSENVDTKRRDARKKTPLHAAASHDAEKAVSKLVERGANLEASDNLGFTALHDAVINECEMSCNMLLQKRANTEAVDDKGKTPLHHASFRGNAVLSKALLLNGANPNARDELRFTPLMSAAHYQHPEVVKCLLGFGADVKAVNKFDRQALDLARTFRYDNCGHLIEEFMKKNDFK